jgi:putative FmdB family regulatory protein
VPTYQYACKDCGHRFETVQSFSDPSLTECPECSGTLRKLFGSVGVIFKGSGFYRNDSRSESKNGGSGKSASADSGKSDSGSSDSGKSESAKSDSGKSDSGGSSSSNSSGGSSSSGSSSSSSAPAAAAS